jgi:hypothetical protein
LDPHLHSNAVKKLNTHRIYKGGFFFLLLIFVFFNGFKF